MNAELASYKTAHQHMPLTAEIHLMDQITMCASHASLTHDHREQLIAMHQAIPGKWHTGINGCHVFQRPSSVFLALQNGTCGMESQPLYPMCGGEVANPATLTASLRHFN